MILIYLIERIQVQSQNFAGCLFSTMSIYNERVVYLLLAIVHHRIYKEK